MRLLLARSEDAFLLVRVARKEFQCIHLLGGGLPAAAAGIVDRVAVLVHLDLFQDLNGVQVHAMHMLMPERVIILEAVNLHLRSV